ncbi:beta-ketoacyl reductase, partial [Frankia sp. Cj3]|uniref:beta-ketoacyl reductase n=1 Tax=Frankia sp. Cj3 TaxID=2880976 RepID=UPI001EF58D92
ALASWWDERRVHATVDSWRYRVTWRAARETARRPLSGSWLLVVPDSHVGTGWVRSVGRILTEQGVHTRQVAVTARDCDRRRLVELLGETLNAPTPPGEATAGVLSLLSLAEERHPNHAAVAWGAAANVALIQALDDANVTAPLWCVTSGAVSTGPSNPVTSPVQALIWGLGGIVAAEHPDRWGGVIDLPATVDEQIGAQLVAALGDQRDETEIAVRGSGLFVRRLVRAPVDGAPRARRWQPRGTAVITGGTGALGGHVARWLARNGAEHLLLISRRGRDAPGSAELEAELNALGAKVTIAACDVADRGALADVLASIPAAYPLTAVVHTAAVLDDALLA